jgi:transcription initiation factor TFIIIB Brf1 subunit/transcription initiation factor TFIIB
MPRTPHERPRRTPYNHHIIFEVSGVPGTRHLVDREDIQRNAARNLGGEYSLLDVKERRRSSWAAPYLSSSYFDVVSGFSPEAVAVALLWTAAKAAGALRPLEDFLKCSKADESRVRKAAWRLKEAVRLGRRPSIEDYVKTLAARVELPASIVRSALELLEKNRRPLAGKNPWVRAAAALWLASFKKLGLSKRLAEAAGSTPASVRNAAKRLRV